LASLRTTLVLASRFFRLHLMMKGYHIHLIFPSDVVLEAMPWPRGHIFVALASGLMASASKVQALALALKAALTILWHHPESHAR